jgi:hypothetical protein
MIVATPGEIPVSGAWIRFVSPPGGMFTTTVWCPPGPAGGSTVAVGGGGGGATGGVGAGVVGTFGSVNRVRRKCCETRSPAIPPLLTAVLILEVFHSLIQISDRVGVGVGAAGVTTHSCRKTVATFIDGGNLSARIGADQLGRTNVSMTQDRYMARGRSHIEIADLLDRAINNE